MQQTDKRPGGRLPELRVPKEGQGVEVGAVPRLASDPSRSHGGACRSERLDMYINDPYLFAIVVALVGIAIAVVGHIGAWWHCG